VLAQLIRPYVITCGMLLVPALAWNAALLKRLPPVISNPDIWGAIPQPLAIAENTLRILIFAVPFFMPLQVSTKRQKRGIALFIVGTLVYFASWLALIASPQSSWATSAAGFLAPAYTPALWLLGLSLLAQEYSWGSTARPWIYATLSVLFLATHISHATIVYVHNYRGAGT
jgi:hypothetical protein